MSLNPSFHVGFYIQVKPQSIEQKTKVNLCSSNPYQHFVGGERNPNKFCPECGAPVHFLERPTTRTEAHPCSLLPDTMEDFFVASEGNETAWVPNFYIKTPDGERVNNCYSRENAPLASPIDLNAIQRMQSDVLKMDQIAKTLAHMHGAYGQESAELKYGVVVVWS